MPEQFSRTQRLLGAEAMARLARVMRRELKKRGVAHLKVVYSKELPMTPAPEEAAGEGRRQTPGSVAFVPSAAGLILAGQVVRDLCRTGG